MQVCIVDDDDFTLSVLDATMTRMGHSVVAAHDGREAMEVLRKGEVRLVITDWDMPGMNGVELCRAVRREDMAGYIYIIMLTGREGAKQRMEGLLAGADDFLNKPLDPEELLVCLKTAERILTLETRDLALFALAKLAENRDSETGAHVERVQSYTRLIARNLSNEAKTFHGVDDEYIRLLYQTCPLHDLGKVGIPDTILLKPGKLTSEEFAFMKTHTVVGAETLDAALRRFPNARFLQMAREIAATHHEKFDGSGYPAGLAGEQIPMCGRIVAVADVYDALTSRRVYKEAMSHEEAKAIIVRDRGSHFDPEVVDAFMRAEEQIVDARARLRDDPVDPSVVQPIRPQLPPAPRNGSGPCKILIAEDDPVLLAKLKELLAATGEPIFTTVDGEDALRVLREHAARIVVSDWVMPKVDGIELCRRINSRPNAEPVHFIMLTAHCEKNWLLDAYKAGVNDFIAKPFDSEELLARVEAGIRNIKSQDELVRKAAGSQAMNAQLATLNSRLERLSITDELTGLFNRRHAMLRLEEQWALVERYPKPLSIAMIDIDHFKKINDTYGHDAGDAILRRVAGILRDQIRATDAVCRFGGEEFLIIFQSQTDVEARACAERCRSSIEEHTFIVQGTEIRATVSIGLATRLRVMNQFPDLLKAADQALYAAKNAGRNVIRVADPMEVKTMPEPMKIPATPPAFAIDPANAPIDVAAVVKRCGGDVKFASAVMERFRAQAGLEVGKLEKALAGSEVEAVSRAAHTLKSMAAYISSDIATDLARRIEDLGRADNLSAAATLLPELKQEIDKTVAWIGKNNQTAATPAKTA